MEDISDAPPENLNPEAPLSANMASATSYMASALSNMASALSYMASVSSDMPSASSHVASASSNMASASSGMASASSHVAPASSGMASATSDAKDRGTDSQESLEEYLLSLLQEKMQEIESLKEKLERVNEENMLMAAYLHREENLEEREDTSQKE